MGGLRLFSEKEMTGHKLFQEMKMTGLPLFSEKKIKGPRLFSGLKISHLPLCRQINFGPSKIKIEAHGDDPKIIGYQKARQRK